MQHIGPDVIRAESARDVEFDTSRLRWLGANVGPAVFQAMNDLIERRGRHLHAGDQTDVAHAIAFGSFDGLAAGEEPEILVRREQELNPFPFLRCV